MSNIIQENHKYLNELGIKSSDECIFNSCGVSNAECTGRKEYFKNQRVTYGFDERETWSLNYTLIGWLYSHLKMYKEVTCIDLSFHRFDVPHLVELEKDELDYIEDGFYPKAYYRTEIIEMSQGEAMDTAISYMEYFLKHFNELNGNEVRAYEQAECSLNIIAIIFGALWW